jgi:hypothetical protein
MSGDATPTVGAGGLGGTWRKVIAAVNAPGSDDKWWARYPIALGMVAGAWYLVEQKPSLWWLSTIFVLSAAVYAREVSLIVLGLGLLIAVISGLAALPLSLAVILGAALIAYGVYRAKDPSVDTRLPLIGKFIANRREAKQAAQLLQNPYYATLRQALDVYWTNEPAHAGQVNAQLMHDIREQLVQEGLAIANSENPVMENRTRLAAAVAECARLQVLVIPPPPEFDSTAIRGKWGVSGELKQRLLDLATANKDLREWLYGFAGVDTWNAVWDAVLTRYWIVLARANVLSALRRPLDDSHPVFEKDWYKPFLEAQCGRYEHEYRESLELPSNLAAESFAATIQCMKLALFVNCVIQGAKYPDLDWRDRCAEIDRAGPDDA